ncbi:MAG: DUF3618 domain-containing protein [Ancrocorticia sp.]|jgi:ABC-type transporter Mla subunit MlaD|nr:DUF3618 domain-containing protein [Ancrocorticia sp.]MCI1896522.1 DUF3618 domain-containing protein [Ancrocorticia sp.]MCI1933191.1 DUF3618 domain-containing protein [Ancrocorticia sp.]MCI1963826.1 DUF3618 domain-containing protein [Ancrocorticia sp.]MCI2002164.1 DUF3618 domain-containing protein [Ancrocorticia sp.]
MSAEETTSEENIRSPQQIEHDIAQTREQLTSVVDELAARLDPMTLAGNATDQAKAKATEFAQTAKETAGNYAELAGEFAKDFAEKVRETVDDAKSGDQQALGILAGSAAAIAGTLALAIRHKFK